MPPKPRTPRAAARVSSPVAKGTPAKRGRPPATAKVVEQEAEPEPPKKRGRPAANTSVAENEAEQPKKRGRPAKLVEEAAAARVTDAPKRGRPAKQTSDKVEELAKDLPKRGRPAKGASLNLNRVAGQSRIAKTTSGTKTTRLPSSRIAPIMRSRLRTRVPVVPKAEVIVVKKPAAKRGRPKLQTKAGPSKKLTIRETIQVKPKKERKRRGFTMLEVPDKFVKEMKKSLKELMDADAAKDEKKEETDQSEQEEEEQQDQLLSEQLVEGTAMQDQESEEEQEQVSDARQEEVRENVVEPEEPSEAVPDIDLEFQMQQMHQGIHKGESTPISASS